ncbi:hypothetical protein [Mycolicibacterium sphagni]|uniref:hypothetical protein n=1 Tax=Mycolicibacterium sphagni TaxID=1786 RepID=UPI0021F39FC8|nr:hypothetical protein [Mycolicibacterium sphagni]MCV7174936.1 hypothetical protein [Mycolicibacterium sphagni]
MPRPYSTLLPPPMGTLVNTYLEPLMGGLLVMSRIPPNDPLFTVPDASEYIQTEASGGSPIGDQILFDCHVILHSYSPYDQEDIAERNCGTALAWMGNAQGMTITAAGYDWGVTFSRVTALAHKYGDPAIPLTRFRGAAAWRIAGVPIAGPSE